MSKIMNASELIEHNRHLSAEIDYWVAQRSEALAILDSLFNRTSVIGETSAIQDEIHKWTSTLSTAVQNLENLKTYFDRGGEVKPVKSLLQG